MRSPAHIDDHAVDVPAARDRVWAALRPFATGLGLPSGGLVGRAVDLVWAAEPTSGFAVTEELPGERLVLEGRHRFSRYRLVFTLAEAGAGAAGGTRLTATSYGDFPGLHGKAYRALVVGTRFHVVAVRRMLRTVAARATA